MNIKKIIPLVLALGISQIALARENLGVPPISSTNNATTHGKTTMDCNASSAQIDLNINNVRARLLTGGDLWWDPVGSNPHYEVPRVPPGSDQPSLHSIFAGALWIGGIDQLGQLKVAAQTYRQTGNDFWPGPLDDDAQVSQDVCNDFDRFWEVRGSEIDKFRAIFDANGNGTIAVGDIDKSILEWPGKNNPYFTAFDLPINKNLAPFWDNDANGEYDPTKGDYPVIDNKVEGVYADQMIWWIFNDKGNIHTETQGEAIGLEVGALAFAFATNDEINNMTFYKYVVDNKSTQPLDSVYFGQWVDSDIGQFDDDYVGCVPSEGLGIAYNGDAVDGSYGDTPPMIGVDFFRGPKKIEDFDNDGVLDTTILGMSAFVFYNNDFTVIGNPENASHFYGYLSGFWKDGEPFTFGGTGKGGDDPTEYMFPDDPTLPLPAWSECSNGNTPADRRFLQSSGPFRLDPGAINDVIVGVAWVREGLQYPCPSFATLLRADKKAQALFDNNFKLKDGPDAPNLTIRELDQELVIALWNDNQISNNAFEAYSEPDPVLASQGFPDSLFTFQGYKLYQLSAVTISPSEFNDPDKARLVAQVDVEDDITQIINYTFDGDVNALIPVSKVVGNNTGIRNTFQVREDLFATGDKKLVNNKKYYYAAIAYAYNNHERYDPLSPSASAQLEPYLEGRNNISVYTAIPHIPTPQNNGLVLNATYGSGPDVKVISGVGNGGQFIDLTAESINTILTSPDHKIDNPVYKGASTPIDIQIYDPVKVPTGQFQFTLTNAGLNTPQILDEPENGTVTVNEETGIVSYNPVTGFEGFDEFTYILKDSKGLEDIGVVKIKIGNPTVTNTIPFNESFIIEESIEDHETSFSLNVLVNEESNGELSLFTVDVLHGDATTFNENGTVTYRPNLNYVGTDVITYTFTDGTLTGDGSPNQYTAQTYIYVYDNPETPGFVALNVEDDEVEFPANLELPIGLTNNDEGSNLQTNILSPFSSWKLTNTTTGDVYTSEQTIKDGTEQAIGGWEDTGLGFTIAIEQQTNPNADVDAVIGSSLRYKSLQDQWLSFIADNDGQGIFNWIRSGTFFTLEDVDYRDYAFDAGDQIDDVDKFYDAEQYYSKILDGRIAPYSLVNNYEGQFLLPVGCSDCINNAQFPAPTFTLPDASSIDLVFTNNKEHWTKSVVVEMARTEGIAENRATKNGIRKHASWSKDGSGSYATPISGNNLEVGAKYYVNGTPTATIVQGNGASVSALNFFEATSTSFTANNGAEVYRADDIGFSWFPGYAINVETGERLNIMFSENSFFKGDNGDDMIWNPTDVVRTEATFSSSSFKIGGEHYIYVMNSLYDEGQSYHNRLVDTEITGNKTIKKSVYDEAMWVTLPVLTPGFSLNSVEQNLIPSTVTMKVRLDKAYETEGESNDLVYEFDMSNKAPTTSIDTAKQALDLVRVVPNPYYAFSQYETSQLDNRVRITNLPAKATISIFTLDGALVKRIDVDNGTLDTGLGGKAGQENVNSVDWDITNFKNVPIASGIYLIHVNAPDLGEERTIKWFCISRPIDLDVF